MIDAKITDSGDIAVSAETGDISLTGYGYAPADIDDAACLAQMARMALSTEKGDFLLQTTRMLGNELMSLIGLPNKPETAKRGADLIEDALRSWGVNNSIIIDTWPVDNSTIGYEVKISISNTGKELTFTLQQALDTVSEE